MNAVGIGGKFGHDRVNDQRLNQGFPNALLYCYIG